MVLSSFYSIKVPDGDFLLLYLSDIYYLSIREIYIYYYERIENIIRGKPHLLMELAVYCSL